MKKILFFLSLVIVVLGVSACTTSQPADNQPVDQAANVFKAATPAVSQPKDNKSADQTNVSAPAAPVENKITMKTPEQQESLTKGYSQAIIKTNYGDIKVKFYGSDSPVTVNNFLNLAKEGFYNGTKFHRVIKGFMIQGGDPLSKGTNTSVYGTGGPGYKFADEFNGHKLVIGSLAMANSGADTNGSQFFIVTAPETPWLDGRHTNFGEVVSGLDIVKKIEAVETGTNDRPVVDVIVNSIELLK